LEKYLEQKDDLHAGRMPRAQADGATVRDVVNRFLTAKQHLLETGEIAARMASVCRERISDERLKAVVDCVYDWLFGNPALQQDDNVDGNRPGAG
jgi:hypothetical protein